MIAVSSCSIGEGKDDKATKGNLLILSGIWQYEGGHQAVCKRLNFAFDFAEDTRRRESR